MADATKLALLDNGPIIIEGTFKIYMADGSEVMLEGTKAALCRCGGSSNKPFCDGTHKKIAFTTVVTPSGEVKEGE
ncbi:MAG: CDGSH iron-sulfur domain-containing protein [Chloroflexaceae bacterium]|nr:CDGSH iron-sulfur domain-containing protein [Chloroflexaceae bacterium]NJL32957.1 CDGSH iron-sulfur domain-containing protein [Chloroflexaceae bacterium]NJO07406.1 CDGSH iron-sulfur domain-containing protein [Chloroflexaceae bacterium]